MLNMDRLSRRHFLGAAAATAMFGTACGPAASQAGPTLRPEDHGAVGDGRADDRRALQAWLAAPAGTHALTAGKTYRIAVGPGDAGNVLLPIARAVRLIGHGATILIADGAGPYFAILGQKDPAVDLTGLWVEGVTFDHNAARGRGFTTGAEQEGVLDAPRHTIYVKRGRRFDFLRNLVRNVATTNAVVYNGDGNTSNCRVNENRFQNVGAVPGGVYHDHSTLYLTGDGIEAAGNQFEASGWGAPGAVCAIEVHPGTGCTIRDNRITGFHTGINYAGVYEHDSRQGVIAGNVIEALRRGIAVYSIRYLGHVAGFGVDDLAIDGNRIQIRNALPRGRMSGGGPGAFGIGIVGGASLAVRNVVIGGGNEIRFDLETAPPDWDSLPAGVMLGETDGTTLFEEIRIGDVTVVNSPVFGITVGLGGGRFRNCSIGRPHLLNCGSTARPDDTLGSVDYRSAIWIAPHAFEGSFRVAGARIEDNLPVARLVNAIVLSADVASNAEVELNFDVALRGQRQSYRRAIRSLDGRIVPLARISQDRGAIEVDANARFRPGSTLTDRASGRVSAPPGR